jgi:hypothetical protein
MAAAAAGMVPLVLSGHFHRESDRAVDGTNYLRIGTTGGAGATVFTQSGNPLSAEVLHFKTGSPLHLVAYDVIDQSIGTGSLRVVRHLVSEKPAFAAEPASDSARPSPQATPTGPSPFVGQHA